MVMRRKSKHPLYYGTAGSYVMRFFLGGVLGVFIEFILFMGGFFFSDLTSQLLITYWYFVLLFPLATGIFGIFHFDVLKNFYDRMHEDFIDDNRFGY